MTKSKSRRALLRSSALVGTLCFVLMAGRAVAQSTTYSFDIPSEPLAAALHDFAKVSGQQIIFTPAQVAGKTAAPLQGKYTADEALARLFAGTDLTVDHSSTAGLMVQSKNVQAASNEAANSPAQLETVTVTGTRIAGEAPVGSPLTVYSRADIVQSGAGSMDQFARLLPGNFSDVDAVSNVRSNSQHSAFSQAGSNTFQGSSFDLHGVGPSATLTLLDGQRIAASGEDGSLSDISLIPLSAIDHVEILDDGASAIYGADAVAGVVNIVTRKGFDGAETSFRYGAATEGGGIEETASQLVGHKWDTGSVLIDYEYDNQSGLDAAQRNYIPSLGGPDTLVPPSHRNSVFLSGEQDIDAATGVSLSGLYSNRGFSDMVTAITPTKSIIENISNHGAVNLYGGEMTVHRSLFGDWNGSITGNYYGADQSLAQTTGLQVGTRLSTTSVYKDVPTDSMEFDASANGSLFAMPAGMVKTALGASYRSEGFGETFTQISNGKPTPESQVPSLDRHIVSGYGELFVPLIGPSNALQWARRVELSASVRYDDYSDFGSTTNPKVGALWEFLPGLSVRSSYGTAFRAPYLSQVGAAVTSETDAVPDPKSAAGTTSILLVQGGNPELKPETSRAFTAGFDIGPDLLSNLKASVTYFSVAFDNRIQVPPVIGSAFLTTPALQPFVTRNPATSLIQSYFNSPTFQGDFAGGGAGAVTALFTDNYTNMASTASTGVEFSTSYDVPSEYGSFKLSSTGQLLFKDEYQPTSASPEVQLLNTYAEPTKWKLRSSLSWTNGPFAAAAFLNYVGSYQNTRFTPSSGIPAWTTIDLQIGYHVEEDASDFLKGTSISLSVLNIGDVKPPYAPLSSADVAPFSVAIPYDAANASPMGRVIAVALTKDL